MARKVEIQIVGDASKLDRSFKQAGTSAKQFGATMGVTAASIAKSAAVVYVVVKALEGLHKTVHAGIEEFVDHQKVVAQTNAALKSTAGVAGMTAKSIDALALSLSNLSGVDDEVIQGAENQLLMFGRVRNAVGKNNDIFTQAMKASLDWSVRSGRSLQTTTIQLGRALEDPARKTATLARAGVVFTKAEQDKIKALATSGKLLEAQKYILEEFRKRMGGAAEAAGKTLPGQLNILKERAKDLAGSIVGVFAPAVAKGATALVGWVKKLSEATSTRAKLRVVWDGVEGIGKSLYNAVQQQISRIDWGRLSNWTQDVSRQAYRRLRREVARVDWAGAWDSALAETRAVGSRVSAAIRSTDFGRAGQVAGEKLASGMRSATRFLARVNWAKAGEEVGRGLVMAVGAGIVIMARFLAGVDWGRLIVGAIKLASAAVRGVTLFFFNMSKAIGVGIIKGIWAGITGLVDWLKVKVKEVMLSILKQMDFTILGKHIVPGLHGLVTKMQAELDALKTSAEETSRALSGIGVPSTEKPAGSVNRSAAVPTGDKGEGGGTGGGAKPPPSDTGGGGTSGDPKWLVAWRSALDRMQLAVDKAGLTKTLKDDIAAQQAIIDAAKRQVALHKGNVEVQRDLISAQKTMLDLKQQERQAEVDARKEQQRKLADVKSQLRDTFGTLFQGPVLNPSDAQRASRLGYKIGSWDPRVLTRDLVAQTAQFKQFGSAIATLQKRGAPTGLLSQLRDMGIEALPQIKALASASAATLAQYFQAYRLSEIAIGQAANMVVHAKSVTLLADTPTSYADAAHIRTLPKMATGGVVTKPTVALIGEAGPEAVVPLKGGRPIGYHRRGLLAAISRALGGDPDPSETAPGLPARVVDSPGAPFRRGGRWYLGRAGGDLPIPYRRNLDAWAEENTGHGISPARMHAFLAWWEKYGPTVIANSRANTGPQRFGLGGIVKDIWGAVNKPINLSGVWKALNKPIGWKDIRQAGDFLDKATFYASGVSASGLVSSWTDMLGLTHQWGFMKDEPHRDYRKLKSGKWGFTESKEHFDRRWAEWWNGLNRHQRQRYQEAENVGMIISTLGIGATPGFAAAVGATDVRGAIRLSTQRAKTLGPTGQRLMREQLGPNWRRLVMESAGVLGARGTVEEVAYAGTRDWARKLARTRRELMREAGVSVKRFSYNTLDGRVMTYKDWDYEHMKNGWNMNSFMEAMRAINDASKSATFQWGDKYNLLISRDVKGRLKGIGSYTPQEGHGEWDNLYVGNVGGVRGGGMEVFRSIVGKAAHGKMGIHAYTTDEGAKLYGRMLGRMVGDSLEVSPFEVEMLNKNPFALMRLGGDRKAFRAQLRAFMQDEYGSLTLGRGIRAAERPGIRALSAGSDATAHGRWLDRAMIARIKEIISSDPAGAKRLLGETDFFDVLDHLDIMNPSNHQDVIDLVYSARPLLKHRTVEDLTWLLEKDPRWTQNFGKLINFGAIDSNLRSKLSNPFAPGMLHMRKYETVNAMIKEWANTSNNTPLAMAIQEAARREFALPGKAWAARGSNFSVENNQIARKIAHQPGVMKALRAFVRAQYENTQSLLDSYGIDQFTAYRGMGRKGLENGVTGVGAGRGLVAGQRFLRGNPLSSWSTDFDLASSIFAGTNGPNMGTGVLYKALVPRSAVLSTPLTGFGAANEFETVLMTQRGSRAWVSKAGSQMRNLTAWKREYNRLKDETDDLERVYAEFVGRSLHGMPSGYNWDQAAGYLRMHADGGLGFYSRFLDNVPTDLLHEWQLDGIGRLTGHRLREIANRWANSYFDHENVLRRMRQDRAHGIYRPTELSEFNQAIRTAQRKAVGGIVGGVGHGDTVPAMLTPGEVVLNARQIKTLGKKLGVNGPLGLFAEAQHMNVGGVVGWLTPRQQPYVPDSPWHGQGDIHIDVVNVYGVQDVDSLMEDLRKKGRAGASQTRGRMRRSQPLR